MGLTYNFADLLETLADAGPDRLTLIAPPTKLTIGQLDDRATRLANHLAAHGVGVGDHVAVHATNRAEWFEAFFACFKLRAVPININYRYVEAELKFVYDSADCVATIVEPEYVTRIDNIRADLPKLTHVLVLGDDYEAALAAASPERNFGPRSNDDIYIVFTGGTTGMPKGVMWRHEDAFFAVAGGGGMGGPPISSPEEIATKAQGDFQLRGLATTPVMHGGAQWGCLYAIFSGNVAGLWTGKHYDAEAVLDLIEAEGINTVQIIGDAMGRPLAEAMAKGTHDLSNLFAVGNGGAPLTASVKAELIAAKPGLVVNDAYGASETGAGGAAVGTDGGPAKFSMSPQLTVLDDDLVPVEPGSGVVGKLARSGHIPVGYYKDEKKTAETFPTDANGVRWVVPGDWATIEADGSIIILGRGSQSINSGGEKIYPEEVESALRAHPAVFDAVVVGTPDPKWGQKVTALVQLRDGAAEPSFADLVAHCRTLVADYKSPKAIHFVPEVVHTPVGKLDYVWAKNRANDIEGTQIEGTA